jgi:Flp pilus assembly secretin CpaC
MKAGVLVAAFLACGATIEALAQEPQQAAKLELKPGFTTLLEFSEPVRTLAIGSPEVADASAQSDRTFLLKANKVGETNLIAINEAGRSIYRATLLVGGGEIGRLTVHSRRTLQDYWTYRCTEFNCQRFDDKYETQAAPPIFVVPASQQQQPGAPSPPE